MELTREKRRQWARWAKGITVFLVVWTLVAMVIPLLPSPWPPFYWALPVHGQVVDAETNTPLAGVIVAAHWELRTEGWSPRTTGQAAVMEDVTNIMGRFTFRWWRPRLRWPWQGYLESDAPGLLFFKRGYKTEFCNNSFAPPSFNLFPSSNCDGAVIKLKKFQGTTAEYAETFWNVGSSLSFAIGSSARGCEWKKIPRMLAALLLQGQFFRKEKVYSAIPPIEIFSDQSRCGSAEKFLQDYLHE